MDKEIKSQKNKPIEVRRTELRKIQSLNHRMAVEKQLNDLADRVNKTYTKEQRIYFITLIKQ